MGHPLRPLPVKLFTGLISNDTAVLEKTRRLLIKRFGPVDLESPVFDFYQTDYYDREMGKGLRRVFLSFKTLRRGEDLSAFKTLTNTLEKKLARFEGRTVNIDPGYITLSKLVLATTKNHGHRLYLRSGIFAEVTLRFHNGSFQAQPWTYPDYRQDSHIAYFNQAREAYKCQIEHDYGPAELYRSL
ncbi:MAG: DUF4416 family protein [Candidatus Omnitrophota bacterium]